MKFSDIKNKTNDELYKIFIDLKKELYNIKILQSNGELKDTSKIAKAKKSVSRVLTLLNQQVTNK